VLFIEFEAMRIFYVITGRNFSIETEFWKTVVGVEMLTLNVVSFVFDGERENYFRHSQINLDYVRELVMFCRYGIRSMRCGITYSHHVIPEFSSIYILSLYGNINCILSFTEPGELNY
jgi:hypothetical protein